MYKLAIRAKSVVVSSCCTPLPSALILAILVWISTASPTGMMQNTVFSNTKDSKLLNSKKHVICDKGDYYNTRRDNQATP